MMNMFQSPTLHSVISRRAKHASCRGAGQEAAKSVTPTRPVVAVRHAIYIKPGQVKSSAPRKRIVFSKTERPVVGSTRDRGSMLKIQKKRVFSERISSQSVPIATSVLASAIEAVLP